MKKVLLLLILYISALKGMSQFYQAVHGSNYAGSLATQNNPASGLSSPLPWDVTVFGFQTRNLLNVIYLENYGYQGGKKQILPFLTNGQFKRRLDNNLNINLINSRLRVDNKTSIGFGFNLRSVNNIKTTAYNFQDSFPSIDAFFAVNEANQPLGASVMSNTWSEIYGSIARNLIDSKNFIWNAGINIKATQGLLGVLTVLDNLVFSRIDPAFPIYYMKDVNLQYFYSRNVDEWNPANSTFTNIKNHIAKSESGFILDLGMEWVIKDRKQVELFEKNSQYNYTWKIGVSLLDLGYAQYKNGKYSGNGLGFNPNINTLSLNNKFGATVDNFETFNDSLKTLFRTFNSFQGKLKFAPPTRLVINVDHAITDMFSVNGELILPANILPSSSFTKSIILPSATITPRFEGRKYGAYLPMTINSEGYFWLGAAFKAGPILLGFHNLTPFFQKKPYPNGGAYLAYVISPSEKLKKAKPKDIKCPD